MSKYCPEISCEFWDDFPDGLLGKKLKKCPFCQNDFITEKPVNPRKQEVEEIFEDPIGEADDNILEHVSKEITDTYPVIEQPSLHNSSAKFQSLKNIETETTTIPTRNNADKTKSDSNPTISAKPKPSDKEREEISDKSKIVNSRSDPLIRPVSDQMQTNSTNIPHSTDDHPNRGKNKIEADDKESEVSKSKRIEQKEGAEFQHTPLSKYTILSEIDPKDTEYVNIQFDTLILKEYYWNKIDAICLRIGCEYFGDFKTSIVIFSEVSEVKLKGHEFVTITGILKFPLKLIRNNEIFFSYKYYVYSNDKKENFEHLHHYSGKDFNRFYILKIDDYSITSIKNNTFHKFDMMILPKLNKGIPFLNITDRRLVSLQAFLPPYIGRGFSQPCKDLGKYLATLTQYVNSLMYFRIQETRTQLFRFWEYYNDDVARNLLNLISVWIKSVYHNKISLDPNAKYECFILDAI